jgi:putative DNA primase/helicase
MTAEAIAKHLSDNAHREGRGWRTECPVHRGFSLSVRDGKDDRLLVHCYAGCPGVDILRELRKLNLSGDDRVPASERDCDTSKADRGRALAQRLWDKSASLTARNLVTSYLQSRAITLPAPPSLRYSPLCPHPDKIRLPAMLAKIVNIDDELIGVHRTYLRGDGRGKADNPTQKASLGSFKGGAIRLGAVRPDDWLIFAEGIETTLSAMQIYNCAGWSAISVSGLDALILPPEAQKILLCADRDRNGIGEKRARAAAIRWVREGRRVRLALPPENFKDFNDALIGGYYDGWSGRSRP